MTPLIWVAVACLGGVALYESLPTDPASSTLEYLHSDKPVVVRLSDKSFEFPVLGARVSPPPNWVHLSTNDPAIAQQPTFLNVTEQLVLTILPDPIASGGVAEDVNEDRLETAIQNIDGIEILWEPGAGPLLSMDANLDGYKFPIQWNLQSPSKIGRLRSDKLRLILVVNGADNRFAPDGNLRFHTAIASFCRRIRPLPLD